MFLYQEIVVHATYYSERHTSYPQRTGISPRITRIAVNSSAKTVYVQMTADVSPLLPAFLNVRPISAWGEAQVRVSGR
ncbi:MAG: hypothetical protein ISS56_20235 [Anaerolineae bacterium]|nr:hypothetical protein [Anaerolineae bacterium]